jgi:hypothetical protein
MILDRNDLYDRLKEYFDGESLVAVYFHGGEHIASGIIRALSPNYIEVETISPDTGEFINTVTVHMPYVSAIVTNSKYLQELKAARDKFLHRLFPKCEGEHYVAASIHRSD